jgi:phosphomannomutase/phosphoglucomutase
MNPHIFREYDIRGVFETDLNAESVTTLGRAFGTYYLERGKRRVAVGRDTRLSSPVIRDWLVEGMTDAGVDVVDIGMVPTPLSYYSTYRLGLDGSVMITGSHNPPQYNGFKITIGTDALFGEQIQELRSMIDGDLLRTDGGGRVEVHPTLVAEYQDDVAGRIQMGSRPLRIVVDAGNGVGGFVALPLFQRLGLEVEGLYCEPDGTFPNHHPDPSEEHNLVALRERVLATGADLGIAYDGDADRIGVIDDKGAILWGDRLLVALARDVLKDNPGAPIVGEVKCSRVLFEEIEKAGGKAILSRVGHSLIKARMKAEGALLAGEMSGHIFYKHRWFGFDDAIYTSARLLEILSKTTLKMSELLADVRTPFVTPETRVDCPDAVKFQVVADVTEQYRQGGDRVVDIDGVRVERPEGWGLVRASNTSPVIVMRAEGSTREQLDGIWEDLTARVRDSIVRHTGK